MALKITVSTGKSESPRSSAGLIKRAAGEDSGEKHTTISVADIVSSVFAELRSSIEKEADVELELTANIEISSKDGSPSLNLDISGESDKARTMRLKFSTKVNPQEKPE